MEEQALGPPVRKSDASEDPVSEYVLFLRGLLDHPRDVSAPAPSSPALAAAIAAQVNLARAGLVVELGPGTGAVTQALLDRGIAPENLLVIENGEYFCALLRERFAGIAIRRGDAMHFERYLPDKARLAAMVSGLPLLNFPRLIRRRLIERALDRQGRHGQFIQLSYGWLPAVVPNAKLTIEKKIVWRNFPPAHIWTYRRPEPV
jgi:phosphatidylethanolamine/phosphatidyl-N-methylethanolamine N-methyltransferase